MRAAVLGDYKERLKLEVIQTPVPGPNEVLVKNAACGVCHTDLHVIENHVNFPVPAVLGHETSGTVVFDNSDTDQLAPGTPCITTFIMPCTTCFECTTGNEDICSTFFNLNRLKGQLYDGTTRLHRTDGTPLAMYSMGGLAEYSVVPKAGVYQIKEDSSIPLEQKCIIGCSIFTAFGAVKNGAGLSLSEIATNKTKTAAVVGCGGVGVNTIQTLRAFGIDTVVAVDMDPTKVEFAKDLGATHTVVSDPSKTKEETVAEIWDAAGGKGVDYCFEVVGRPATFDLSISALGDGGKAVCVGIADQADPYGKLEITRLVRRKLVVQGSYGAKARADTPEILALVDDGRLKLGAITEEFSLEDAGIAYEKLLRGEIVGKAIVKI